MAYTTEQYEADRTALNAAQNVLSALVVGEKNETCAEFGEDYARMAQYFEGIAVRRVLRTFLTIAQAPRITGMECGEFSKTLAEVDRMIRSKRKFFRRTPKKCFKPLLHGKGCACANFARSKAKMDEPLELTPTAEEKLSFSNSNILDREEQRLRREMLKL